MEYKTLSDECKRLFGTKVYKLSLQTGCTCPNRDGTVGYGGCTFCSEGGSGDFAAPLLPIDEQIRIAKTAVDHKFSSHISPSDRRYIAYFQSFSNTYGDTKSLLTLFERALQHPEIVAVSIGTRPDCISDEMIEGLSRLNLQKPVWVELGLQTIHENTAIRIHRGYTLDIFEVCYQKLKAAGLTVIVHVILGLPGESRSDMLETISYLSDLSPALDGIKLQLLHILRGTALYEEYQKEPFPILTLDEYTALVVDCIRILPEDIVVHRITGDGPKKLLVEPAWSGDKKRVLNTLTKVLREA